MSDPLPHRFCTPRSRAHAARDLDPAGQVALLERELADLELLFRVVNLMHATLDPEHIARITLTSMTAGTALGMNRAAMLLVDEEAGTLRGYLAVGPQSREAAQEIWTDMEREPLPLEELVRLALGSAPGPGDAALSARVKALSYPIAALGAGPLAKALEGAGGCFEAPDVLPAGLRDMFDGPSGFVVPLRATERVLGVVVADRFAGEPSASGERLALALEVAHQAGLAMGNAQQLNEVRIRAAQLGTLHELGKHFLAVQDLGWSLHMLVRCASEVTSARAGVVWLSGEKGLQIESRWAAGDAPASAELDAALIQVAMEATRCGETVLAGGPENAGAHAGLGEGRSVLCAPLLVRGRVIGALAVYDHIAMGSFEPSAFDRHDRQFLGTLADQAANAVENLRLMESTRQSEQRLRETQALLLRNEKLAALGEMSAKVAHEIRNPLAAIGGFARRVTRSLGQSDPNREAMELIVRETERLERILSEQLQFAQLSRPRLQMEDLNKVLGETLQLLGPALGERKVRLIKRLGPDIPPLLLDPDKIKQVLLNILQNALQNVSHGGRVRVETRRLPEFVEVDVANDGPKIPGEVMERLFVPFCTSREHGTGLGLAVADQIVREHGGEIRVRSDSDWGCVFSVVLPLEGNTDRRRHVADRRSRSRTDRREAA
ncbi:MAG TPA: ATP-binding protein [Candidatus Saccharimonadales bacterium]|nr:ATP-binding protein [Candidatus Saccharimonadales bacterium]